MDRKDLAKYIGDKIYLLRVSKRLNQMDIHAKTGLAQSFLSNIENGRVSIDVYDLIKLACYFGVSITELLPVGSCTTGFTEIRFK